MVNRDTGKERRGTYLGVTFHVYPTAARVAGYTKQLWTVALNGEVIGTTFLTLSKAQYAIHRHPAVLAAYTVAYAHAVATDTPMPTLKLH